MPTDTRQPGQCPWILHVTAGGGLTLLFLLNACMLLPGTRPPAAEPPAAAQAEATQPAVSASAAARGTSEEPATETAPPPASLSPSPPTVTPTPACTDLAALVYDVTVPDNTRMPAGRSFAKAWRLQNAGTCTWTPGYALVFDSGAQMGGPSSQPLTEEVLPGATIDLSVILTTPSAAGTYRGNWKLQNELGMPFGLAGGEPFHVQLIVSP